jgi:type VI secretion system secreted protein Hcp
MAIDAFLKIDGIAGNVKGGLVQLESFSWGLSNSGTPTCSATGGGGGTGKVSFQDFSFTSLLGSQSPQLFVAAATGKHIPSAQLTLTQNAQPIAVTFFDVFVSNYKEDQASSLRMVLDKTGVAMSGQDSAPLEFVSFNFLKIEIQAGGVTEIFDICQNKLS